ncbi:hypothetical protein GYMLUDRAFT_274709 [Collybiopsis luxurians FD-317 M1]|nr:hypothetical protein GYMLUDRAFT_274709 [Collybiopsis luxurians FD-317 M1]
MSFSSLPSEIYAAVIDQLDEYEAQPIILALTRAIPAISQHQLFRRIRFANATQLAPFYQRIQQADDPCKWVQIFLLETWIADAELTLNILSLLPNLHTLSIWIGPKNITPEHLEELFSIDRKGRYLKCVDNLRYLSLRFRPYVQKATYHQFLSGSYFDSTLEALSRWFAGQLPTLSIVQDPLTNESGTSDGSEVSPPGQFSLGLPQRTLAAGFAQPIVFFKLEAAFPSLLRSSYFRLPLRSLRLRFPSRNVVRSLTQAPLPQPPSYGASIAAGSIPSKKYARPVTNAHLSPTPYLTFLDLSTCLITESSISEILGHYPFLTRLVLDDCAILRIGDIAVRDNSSEWGNVASRCAVAGIGKAKEGEKKVNAWLDTLKERERVKKPNRKGSKEETTKRSKGRKGPGAATIPLRKDNTMPSLPSGPMSTPSEGNDYSSTLPSRIRILPPSPTLRHFTATLYVPQSLIPVGGSETGTLSQDIQARLLENIHNEWERGWAEGLSQLVKVRERLRMSWRNKLVRVMRFAPPDVNNLGARLETLSLADSNSKLFESENEDAEQTVVEDYLGGLIDVTSESEFDVGVDHAAASSLFFETNSDALSSSIVGIEKPPVLCLAGTTRNEELSAVDLLLANSDGTVAVRGLAHTSGCAHEFGRKLWRDGID